jgi:hypothetical protein
MKLIAIICLTLIFISLISIVFYLKHQGNKAIFEWFVNIQIFFAGFISSFGLIGIKVYLSK